MPVWNRLWCDTQCKVLETIIILAKLYIEIRNESLVWHSAQIHMKPKSIRHVLSRKFFFLNVYPIIL